MARLGAAVPRKPCIDLTFLWFAVCHRLDGIEQYS